MLCYNVDADALLLATCRWQEAIASAKAELKPD
jgi:hypothetical protein